ncbi:tyrosine-type recombinase/integrase [Eubacteriales bacterium OttesenSCG-928-K08]|nr:tyrosine-type recombinase/integrase [Eubacteriales bacterium OttesenSCG-928-K08]
MRTKILMQTVELPTLKESYLRFLQNKRIANVSADTIRYYDGVYKMFSDFTGDNFPCDSIAKETVFEFIEHMKKQNPNIRDTSINSYLRGVRSFLYFCMEEGLTQSFKISLIKAEKQLKETYTHAELERLLKKPEIKKCEFSEYRNWVIICYLLGTGNRARTLCNVKIGDIDFDTHEIKLKAVKNSKQYIIPLSKTLEKTLVEYLGYRQGTADDYLFCNIYGQQLGQEALKTAIRRYNNARGVSKTSIHLFRHTFAKNWILNNGDIFRLQKILGHSSIEIVKEYVNMFGNDLQMNFAEFNPLDNMEIMKRNNGAIKMRGEGN